MSTRPQRRVSSLANQHPATPAPAAPVQPAVPAPAPVAPAAATPTRKRRTAAAPAAKAARPQTNFYADPQRMARVKAAFMRTRGLEDYISFSDFIVQSLERTATELEAKYNNGQPWEGQSALPAGRPLKS